MSNFSKHIHNPLELMKEYYPTADLTHITYDPNMKKGQYDIIRQTGHDGTMLFTYQMFNKAFIPLICMTTYYKPTRPQKEWTRTEYTIGRMRHAIACGKVKLKCGVYPGLVERIRIPVICRYMHNEY